MKLPAKGCLVRKMGSDKIAVVEHFRVRNNIDEIGIRQHDSRHIDWVLASDLGSAYSLGMEVVYSSNMLNKYDNEVGTIAASRKIGGRDQHLVDFPLSGSRWWIPFENLRYFRSVRVRFENGVFEGSGGSERFRLRNLAFALENWHQNTGALTHLDIDPLPHQIHLVHHILKSGNLNWLIADDVGLGKTVETGMLLSALQARGTARRILLICPAGLVRQWKEEMHVKFGLSDFSIYGEDFFINDPRDWKRYDFVIGSLDLMKSNKHMDILLKSEPWDIIVFDEAHRLSRTQWGMKYDTSDRYRLASHLRKKTPAMILLSATPHQGRQDKFQSLLTLLRPDLKSQIEMISINPWLLKEMVIRNHKADVTDSEGRFIFQGKQIKTLEIEANKYELDFDTALREYLEKGYGAARTGSGAKARAIGFVMTVYRKLAASSIYAIESALKRRLERLRRRIISTDELEALEDDPFQGEWEEISATSDEQFFFDEDSTVENLIKLARRTIIHDTKFSAFKTGIIEPILEKNSLEKILIFTEYRSTQEYLNQEIIKRYGKNFVTIIHGGMNANERRLAIEHFESDAQFLISTEAGGEGINLQKNCHIMVNYDLPWNPMRLVQRIGRLYRYGQKFPVMVFNMKSPDTIDSQIVGIMYERIQQVVADMKPISEEFRPGLEDEILGQVVDLLDIESILEESHAVGIVRTRSRIEEALKKARESAKIQRDIFDHVASYDSRDAEGELRLTRDHAKSFVLGMCRQLEIIVTGTSHNGSVFILTLPDYIRETLGLRGSTIRITFERHLVNEKSGIFMLDAESALYKHFIKAAKSHDFYGLTATASGLDAKAVIVSVLRWQTDQGVRMREEYCAALVNEDGSTRMNPEDWKEWLLVPAEDAAAVRDKESAQKIIKAAVAAFDRRLSDISSSDLHPEGMPLISACIFPES
jgi:ERCC4-related helicase